MLSSISLCLIVCLTWCSEPSYLKYHPVEYQGGNFDIMLLRDIVLNERIRIYSRIEKAFFEINLFSLSFHGKDGESSPHETSNVPWAYDLQILLFSENVMSLLIPSVSLDPEVVSWCTLLIIHKHWSSPLVCFRYQEYKWTNRVFILKSTEIGQSKYLPQNQNLNLECLVIKH